MKTIINCQGPRPFFTDNATKQKLLDEAIKRGYIIAEPVRQRGPNSRQEGGSDVWQYSLTLAGMAAWARNE